ncbi:MAG TPA: hypothetical protein VG895_02545 [Patescibacteria group bacterium]|nr:hypothetical protein [Patescibacteria group bacterium]
MVEINPREIQKEFIEGHISSKPEINSLEPFTKVDESEIKKLKGHIDGEHELAVDYSVSSEDPLE